MANLQLLNLTACHRHLLFLPWPQCNQKQRLQVAPVQRHCPAPASLGAARHLQRPPTRQFFFFKIIPRVFSKGLPGSEHRHGKKESSCRTRRQRAQTTGIAAPQQICFRKGSRGPFSSSHLSPCSRGTHMEVQEEGLPGQSRRGKMPPWFCFKYFKNDLSEKRVPARIDIYKVVQSCWHTNCIFHTGIYCIWKRIVLDIFFWEKYAKNLKYILRHLTVNQVNPVKLLLLFQLYETNYCMGLNY